MVAIASSKKVIFEIHDNYQKQTYRNRAYIAHTNGRLLLNVPVKHSGGSERQKMQDVITEDSFPWQSQHWKSLQTAYRTSPFFEYYEDDIEPLFSTSCVALLDHNLEIFKVISDLLGISADIEFSSSYEVSPEVTDYRFLVNAKKEPDFGFTPYTQVLEAHHGFLPNLSVLDLLFNEGPNALQYLEDQQLNLP